ncbi:hypothetical protein BDN72DRAFT_903721 [Pluteus cervinus]|uniref:Uncharacterized protein n=1 Tax=Pluteus cervinus TaxID=181527 RepID=A0ACD3A8A8_9AGAR|nr:hypothetical protein BDN72DRAFT_903721 [Pluteus cervinus]
MQWRRTKSSQNPSFKSSKSSKSDALLQISSLVLSTIQDAASYAPVPGLQQAAGVALAIIDAAQTIKTNKQAYAQLAEDVCEILYIVIRSIQNAGQKGFAPSDKLVDDLRKVKGKLDPIAAFVEKQKSRNIFKRLLYYKADAGTIQDYRNTLKDSLGQFGFESQIALRETTARMMAQQEELLSQVRSQQPSAPVDPRQLYGSMAGFPPIVASGTITVTNIGGDYNVSSVNSTTINNDSGNTYHDDDDDEPSSTHRPRRGARGPRRKPVQSIDDSDSDEEMGIKPWKPKGPKYSRRR